ncbi:MAG: alpha/beta hydrolase [Dehalococcoidia bacterium]
MKSYIKFAFIFTLVQGILSLIAFMGYIAYSIARVKREPLQQTPMDVGLEYTDVVFPSRVDRLTLKGWWVPGGKGDRSIIMVHGGERHRADPYIGLLSVARDLVKEGYSVLLFDMRARGESEGKRSSVGYYERRDLLGAIDYVSGRGIAPDRIGILGFSLGGAIALLVAGNDGLGFPVISDSSFADLPKLIEREASKRIDLPSVFNIGWMLMSKAMYGVNLGVLRPVEAIKKLSLGKVFLIHGAEDEIVPVADARLLHAATNNTENGLWIVPDAGHTRAYKSRPEEYIRRVVSFFDGTLGP